MTDRISLRSVGRQSGRPGSSSVSDSNASRSSFHKRRAWSRRGVSDIIGNILILAITVSLFTGILYFVSSMPGPQEKVYTDFVASTSGIDVDNHTTLITVTHKGGDSLADYKTNIYLFQDNTPHSLKITNSLTPILNNVWTPGSTWTYLATGVYSNTSLSIMIVDTEANTVVYSNNLIGGQQAAMSMPIIANRGMDPSPTYVGNVVSFYAMVTDPFGKLDTNSVYLNASAIGLGSLKLWDYGSNNIYWTDQAVSFIAQANWNNKTLLVNATDENGEVSQARMVLTVLPASGGSSGGNPLDSYNDALLNGTYPSDATGGENGGGNNNLGTTFYYIRRMADNVITKDFDPGEGVLIELYSNSMLNLALENSFTLYNPISGDSMPQSKVGAFTYGGIYNNFYRYVYNFSAPDTALTYSLLIKMKDYYGTVLSVRDVITVSDANYPFLETYILNKTTNSFELAETFTPADRVYLKIVTKDVNSDLTKVTCGNIEVSDYSGRYVIRKAPPTATTYPSDPAYSAPLSSIYKTSSTSSSATRVADIDPTGKAGTYTLYIELKAADLGWWLAKKNSYTLRISFFSETSDLSGTTYETYHELSTQFNVTAPMTMSDIIASIGTGSYTWSAAGAEWTDNKLMWYEKGTGSEQWSQNTIADPTYNGPLGLVQADMDGDGIKDLVVGFQDPTVAIAWYKCENVEGTEWSETPNIISLPFDAYGGQNPASPTSSGIRYTNSLYGTNDFGKANEDVTVYHPDAKLYSSFFTYNFPGGFITSYDGTDFINQNEMVVALATGDFNGDGYTDIVASFAHVVVYSTAVRDSEIQDASKNYAMFFNRGVYVFWNDGLWTKTALSTTMDWTTSTGTKIDQLGANSNLNPAVLDLAVGDINKDGCDDIVGVYETGKTNIWMSNYLGTSGNLLSRETGAFAAPPVTTPTTAIVGGTNPYDHTQRIPCVRLAQMDSTQPYLDIVRTSTTNNNVFVIHTTGKSTTTTVTNPSVEYGPYVDPSAKVTHMAIGLTDLVTNDTNIETLTEVYQMSTPYGAYPQASTMLGPYADTTSKDRNDIINTDGLTYNVDPGKSLNMNSFYIDGSNMTRTVVQAKLMVTFAVDPTYNGGASILWSKDGNTFTSTGITPTSSNLNVTRSFDLFANGATTVDALTHLSVYFNNNGAAGSVKIDRMWIEIRFVESRYLDWIWEVPNNPAELVHDLTFLAKCSDAETYRLSYSTDNNTWFDIGTISGTSQTVYTAHLIHTTNLKYYIRVVDSVTGSGDLTNSSLLVNLIQIAHKSYGVEWLAGNLVTSPIISPGAGEYITSLAVGDIGKGGSSTAPNYDHRPDGLNDVVVGTSKVGQGDSTHTLYILTQTNGQLDAPMAVDTSTLASQVGGSTAFDIAALELGDFNGDYNLDIALVVGYGAGKSGGVSFSTIWIYYSEPQVGSWTFTEKPLNALSANEAGINIKTGNVNLDIAIPFLGIMGVMTAATAVQRLEKRKKE